MIELVSALLIFASGFCWGMIVEDKRVVRQFERLLEMENQHIAELREQLKKTKGTPSEKPE